MRVEIGRKVDIEQDVNLADLSPLDRIISAAANAYRNTSIYKRRFAESEERKSEMRRRRREALTDSILSVLYKQLHNNSILKAHGDECTGVLLEIPFKYNRYLSEVLSTHDFDPYNVTVIPPNRSIAKFAEPPTLLYIESRGDL